MRWTTKASITFPLSCSEVFSVLTAYDRYHEWIAEITSSQTLAREGDIAIVELISPHFEGGSLVLEVVHTPPDAAIFSQAERHRRSFGGSWQMQEEGDGDSRVLRLTVRIEVAVGLLDLRRRRQLRALLEATLNALRARSASVAPGTAGERRKIVEVVLRPDALEVWLMGETFTLTRQKSAEAGE